MDWQELLSQFGQQALTQVMGGAGSSNTTYLDKFRRSIYPFMAAQASATNHSTAVFWFSELIEILPSGQYQVLGRYATLAAAEADLLTIATSRGRLIYQLGLRADPGDWYSQNELAGLIYFVERGTDTIGGMIGQVLGITPTTPPSGLQGTTGAVTGAAGTGAAPTSGLDAWTQAEAAQETAAVGGFGPAGATAQEAGLLTGDSQTVVLILTAALIYYVFFRK